MSRSFTVTFDASDPAALAVFWAEALGYVTPPPPNGFETWDAWADAQNIPVERRDGIAAINDPEDVGPRLLFLKVPEGKTAKNRVHLDVHTDRSVPEDERVAVQDALAASLVEAGATMVERRSGFSSTWVVLLDPEGNEFCVV